MLTRHAAVTCALLGASLLAGCDQLTGVAEQKSMDAEAIGYACRVSGKSPEDCMKENDAFNPSPILDGWKNADQDIKEGNITLGAGAAPAESSSEKPAEGEAGKEPAKKKEEGKPDAESKGNTH